NVIAASSGYYKVLDFGVARIEADAVPGGNPTQLATRSWATSAGGLLGTIAYMSPEQALAEPLDARSDIFSMGSLLYELATGRPAFSGNNAIATANAIVHQQPAPLRSIRPRIPEGLALVIEKCMAKRPDDRYPTADALVRDLRTLQLSSLSTSRSYRGLLAHRERPLRGRRWPVLAGAALLVLFSVLLSFAIWLRRDGAAPATDGPPSRAPSAATALPATGVADKPRVIVAFFENPTGDPAAAWLVRGLPEMLTTDLSRSDKIEVIATQKLYDLASMAGGERGVTVDRTTIAELARWAGADLVISGSVFKLGEVYRIDAQAYDTDSGTIRVARKVEGADLLAMATELAAGLREQLRLDEDAPSEPLQAATSSAEAFRLYTAAAEASDHLEFGRAVERLTRSLELDPRFSLARLRLAMSQYELGDVDGATASVRQVVADAERLPEAERMLAEALESLWIRRDLEGGSARLERLIESYPRHRSAYVVWARALDRLGDDPLAATRKLQRAIEQDPNNLLAIVSLAEQMARFGATDDAEAILREAARRNPGAEASLERWIRELPRPAQPGPG
ncbi:MAG TPA: protein kinase, partial [Candidatus Polarisedimenticolaceae bacterium]|nr:protein kinase [Candidatus Polarisedimenticolaceae bacterium]